MRLVMLLAAAAVTCCSAASLNTNSVHEDDKPTAAAAAAADEPGTHALLSRLGLQRLRTPAAHTRKRLAVQARRHASGDSRMFVIKLPPSTSYYAHALGAAPAPSEAARTLPLPLRSNGKPARVYHWNLPLLHKQARLDEPAWSPHPHPNSLDAPSYYAPRRDHASFRKYFSGNGKPKSFYVIDKNKKPTHYHRLLP